jgi:hypothetical protein
VSIGGVIALKMLGDGQGSITAPHDFVEGG